MIKGVAKVVVDVSDQSRAVRFWTERLGFRVVRDEEYAGRRWVEIAPPNGSVVLVLTKREPDQARHPRRKDLPESKVFFRSDDVVYTYQVLAARGVRFPVSPVKDQSGWWAVFEDDEGVRYGLGEW